MPMRAELWVYAMLAREAKLHIVLATGFYREAWEREPWEYAGCVALHHQPAGGWRRCLLALGGGRHPLPL